LKPSEARTILKRNVEAAFPESSTEAMATLPAKSARTRTFQNKRQEVRPADIDPMKIPHGLAVSFILINSHDILYP
jgi:hypothetical protein